MFREMRRIRQQISQAECVEILNRATSGVSGLHGDDGYPYTVPVSFVYQEGGTGLGIIASTARKPGTRLTQSAGTTRFPLPSLTGTRSCPGSVPPSFAA